ncbi:MAG: hypothetical protein ACRELF_10195 [Gemmataceae bacterium]
MREFFVIHFSTVLSDEPFELLKLLVRGLADHSIPQPSLVGDIRSTNRGDMLTVHFEDVFAPVPTTDDESAIVQLHEHIMRPRPLNIVDHLADRAALSRTQTGMSAPWNTGASGLRPTV